MAPKLHRLEMTLLNDEGQIIADISTSCTNNKNMIKLFNKIVKMIAESSNKNWGIEE